MDRFPGRIAYEPQPIWLSASRFRIFSGILKAWNIRPARWKKREGEFTVDMRKLMVRYLSEVFVAFLVVAFVAGLGSILGLSGYATRLHLLLPLFAGPTYLFFILVGSGLGYIVNRRQCSMAAPWVWILPAIWS